MATSNITVNTIVKNEDRWIWYAIASVIDHVDRLIIYDTGSTDHTVEIIKSFGSKKIVFEEKGSVTPAQLTSLRNVQIEQTKTEWFMLLDGDEVWPESSITSLRAASQTVNAEVMGIVVKALLPVGDLYHLQDEQAGKYELMGMKGHFNIRLYRKKKGYKWRGDYPLEAYTDNNAEAINGKNNKLYFEKNAHYFHMRLMERSSRVKRKKIELGERHSYTVPEVFNQDRPPIVQSPWVKLTRFELLKAWVLYPIYIIKRSL